MCWAYWKETGEVPEEMGKVREGCLQRPVWKGTYVINLNEAHHSSNNTMACCTADVQEALFLPHGLCFVKTSLITHGICPLPAKFVYIVGIVWFYYSFFRFHGYPYYL